MPEREWNREAAREPLPATLAYGRLAIGALALVSIGSAAALTIALACILTAQQRLPGLPYGDIPAALIAIGVAASLASLSSAAAYSAQVAQDGRAARTFGALRATTFALMTAAYLAFAAGGMAFAHFCLTAARVLGRIGAPG